MQAQSIQVAKLASICASLLAIVGFFTASLTFLQVFVCLAVQAGVFKVFSGSEI